MATTSTRSADLGEIKTVLATMSADIAHLAARQGETIELLQTLNGSVRAHGEDLATSREWRRQHGDAHSDLEAEVRSTRERTYQIGMINGVFAALAAAAAAVASAFRPGP